MRVLFSKTREFDGNLSIDPETGEVGGLVQLAGVPLKVKDKEYQVWIAGTLVVDPMLGETDGDWTVKALHDVSLPDQAPPKKFPVSGVATKDGHPGGPGVDFKATFHATSYFRAAWEALLNPGYEGDGNF